MDSIPLFISETDFPPDVIQAGTSFTSLASEDIERSIMKHESELQSLREKMAHHHRAIAKYQGCRNSISTINRTLPREIIAAIMVAYRNLHGYTNYKWINLAHVCRYWRGIALTTSALLSHIYIKAPRMESEEEEEEEETDWEYSEDDSEADPEEETFIARTMNGLELIRDLLKLSGNSPLYLTVRPENVLDLIWNAVYPQLYRVQTLRFLGNFERTDWPACPAMKSFSCEYLDPVMYGIISHIMPNLKRMHLYSMTSISPRRGVINITKLSLPPTLVALTLDHQPVSSMGDLMEMLLKLPRLKFLSLMNMRGGEYQETSQVGSNCIQLRHLKRLSLRASQVPVLALLRHISTVNTIHIRVRREDPFLLVPSLLYTKLKRPNGCTICCLHLEQLDLDNASSTITFNHPSSSSSSRLGFQKTHKDYSSPGFSLSYTNATLASLISSARGWWDQLAPHVSPVTHFDMSLQLHRMRRTQLNVSFFQDALETLREATHLKLGLYEYAFRSLAFLDNFINLAIPLQSDPERSQSMVSNIILPELRVFYITIDGSRDQIGRTDRDVQESTGVLSAQLYTLLRARQDHGVKLDTLELDLSRCRTWFSDDAINLFEPLKEVVGILTVYR